MLCPCDVLSGQGKRRGEDQGRDRPENLSRAAGLHTLPLVPPSVQNGWVGRRGSLGFGGRDREGLRAKCRRRGPALPTARDQSEHLENELEADLPPVGPEACAPGHWSSTPYSPHLPLG